MYESMTNDELFVFMRNKIISQYLMPESDKSIIIKCLDEYQKRSVEMGISEVTCKAENRDRIGIRDICNPTIPEIVDGFYFLYMTRNGQRKQTWKDEIHEVAI